MTSTEVGAWVGMAVGAVLIIRQIVILRRPPHRVRVTTGVSVPAVDHMSNDPGAYLTIEARNFGTSAVGISDWGIDTGGKTNALVRTPVGISTPVPHHLASGAEATFYFLERDLRDVHAQTGFPYSEMRPWVQLTTGETIRANRAVPLE